MTPVDGSASLARIRDYVHRHRERLATPGVAIAATDRDRCLGLVLEGEADVAAGTPVAAHHRFQIGSVSKGFTALAVLQQVEEERIDLDAPVTAYLPWFRVGSSFGPITIHHLLSHTAGIVTGTDVTGEAASDVWMLRETVAGFAPGERFHYSNCGFKALGLVLEAVTGRPWWRLVRERVMRPIGMGDADVIITNEARGRLATGHMPPFDDRPWLPRHGWAAATWVESATADGTICATAEELSAYARLLLNGGAGVVTTRSFERMTTPVAGDPDEPDEVYGYGIRWLDGQEGLRGAREASASSASVVPREGRRLLGHTGSMVGFTAHLLVDVAVGVGVVILMNSAIGRRTDLARFAVASLAAEAAGEPLPEVPDATDPTAIERGDDLAGRYVDGEGPIEIEQRGSGLSLHAGASEGVLVAMDADDTYAVDHPELERFPVRFIRDGGAIVGVFWGPRWLRRQGAHPATDADAPAGWSRYPGRYSSWNPWEPGFRVFLRRGRLWLARTGDPLGWDPERELTPVDDEWFRVGDRWSPDHVRFDWEIAGATHRATFDGAPFYRRVEPER